MSFSLCVSPHLVFLSFFPSLRVVCFCLVVWIPFFLWARSPSTLGTPLPQLRAVTLLPHQGLNPTSHGPPPGLDPPYIQAGSTLPQLVWAPILGQGPPSRLQSPLSFSLCLFRVFLYLFSFPFLQWFLFFLGRGSTGRLTVGTAGYWP